jgi:uncharacterized tellurite resistance protein B-like protein
MAQSKRASSRSAHRKAAPKRKPMRKGGAKTASARKATVAKGRASTAKRPSATKRIAAKRPTAKSATKRTAAKQSAAKPSVAKRMGAKAAAAPHKGNGNGHARPHGARPFRLPSRLIVSPDITRHPWEHRRDYLILVSAIAASDGELHPDELKLLTGWMDRFELPPEAREAVLHVANRGDVDLVEIATRLASTPLTWSVMLDMMGMAMADGVLMDDEILLLRGLASVLQIDPVDFNILIDFVHSAHQAAQISNPEPLYEHAIESAFQLLSKRHVKLFKHTRLCVNYPEYDTLLKARWTKYDAAVHAGAGMADAGASHGAHG